MTDCTGLAGNTAACHAADNIKLIGGFCQLKRLTNDQFEGIQSKIIVNITVVNGYLSGTLINPNAGDRAFSSAGSVKIRRFFVQS